MPTMTGNISTPETLDAAPAHSATIASVSDQEWHVTRTYGAFRIPACAKNEPCAVLRVTPRGDAIDLGDNRRFPFVISAREIAEDIIQDLADHGVFVCAAAHPAAEELAAARDRRDAWFRRLIAEADEMWARGHSYREISDMHRRAAAAMGLEREWAYVPQRQMDCPVCGEKVKPGVAICRHCGAVLDAERAAKYFPASSRETFAPRASTGASRAPEGASSFSEGASSSPHAAPSSLSAPHGPGASSHSASSSSAAPSSAASPRENLSSRR